MSSEIVFKRILKMDLPQRQSAFFWGARKTGKSFYLTHRFPNSIRYDLLKTDVYLRLAKEPHLLREEVLALSKEELKHPIIIDEVQKVPELLNEVHWLIENSEANFILCGSSARKLRIQGVNLLGGRAWRYSFYPLVYKEIPDFNLLQALNMGLIPSHYLSREIKRSLRAYIEDYLTLEIQAEGLTRNIPAFARFLDSLVFGHGTLLNYSNIARECGIDSKTVKEYYQILIDTLLGYYVFPYAKKKSRDIIRETPKFYLFDVGVMNFLMKRTISALKGNEAGDSFEHYIFMELIAYRGIQNLDFEIYFWRTKTNLEVDFILGNAEVAIEVKISENPQKVDLKGLIAFQEEHKPKQSIVVCLAPKARKISLETGEINIYPWEVFLNRLWSGEII